MHKNISHNILHILTVLTLLLLGAGGSALAEEEGHYDYVVLPMGGTPDEEAAVRAQIQERARQLNEINQQILANQKKLQETQSEKQTVSTEIKKIDTNIKQIDLSIRSSEVLIEKLDYELDALGSDILQAQEEAARKEIAVGDILRNLQGSDSDNLLLVVLRDSTLSEGLLKAQALADMNSALLANIRELNQTKDKLNEIKNNTALTKEQKEAERVNYQNKKVIASELKQEKNKTLELTKQKESEYQKSLRELEEKQAAIAAEIEKMEEGLRKEINYGELPQNLPGVLAMPVKGIVTQEHGATRFAKTAYRGKWHNGLDFGAPIGTPIIASEDGIVVAAEDQDRYCRKGAYGKYVAIRHSNGLTTLYAHMSRYIVTEGSSVKRGETIGYVGNTGYATGPHLHYGVYDSKTFRIDSSVSCGPKMPFGGDLDPRNYLQF